MRKVYVDADILCYHATLGMDDEFDGGVVIDPKQAEELFDSLVCQWTHHLEGDELLLCLTGENNYRYDLYPEYKAKRTSVSKPPNLGPLRRVLLKRDNVIMVDGLEADDVIGMACSADPENTIAVSLDKDFKTVPLTLYRPAFRNSVAEGPTTITEDQANLYWMRQTIIGDPVDNIKGLPRAGKVKAEKTLPNEAPLEVLWASVVNLYVQSGSTREEALLNARLTRILRHGEYDGISGVRLWDPSEHVPEGTEAEAAGGSVGGSGG